MAITLSIKLKDGKRIETDYDKHHADKLEEILALKEEDFLSVIGVLEDTYYNMDYVNKVVCIATENHIELISMSELKNLREVIICGFYDDFLLSMPSERKAEMDELFFKAYACQKLAEHILP